MRKFDEVDGGNPNGTAKDRVGSTPGTKYLAKYWNDNIFNMFTFVENAGYSLIDDDLSQITKASKGLYNPNFTYNTSAIPEQTVSDVARGSDGKYYEAQNDGFSGDDPVGSVSENWLEVPFDLGTIDNGLPTITGTATFTNSTQNINLVGVGALQDLEVGDVIQVTDSVSNDTEYTVEFITNSDNIIVNYEHRGQTSSKSLTDETSTSDVTIKILAKWYNAPSALGRGWCSPTSGRFANTIYINSTGRTIPILVKFFNYVPLEASLDGITWIEVGFGTGSTNLTSYPLINNNWRYRINGSTTVLNWKELR